MENPLQAESGEFLRALFLFPTQDLVEKTQTQYQQLLESKGAADAGLALL